MKKAIIFLTALNLFATIVLGDESAAKGIATILAATKETQKDRDESKLVQVTTEPFQMSVDSTTLCRLIPATDSLHDRFYCHIFVNKIGKLALLKGSKHPAGSIIVKEKLRKADSIAPELFTVMRKMHAGYDTDHGDWEYSIVSIVDGKHKLFSRGKTKSCVACHESYSDTDYVTRSYLPKLNTDIEPKVRDYGKAAKQTEE